MNWERICLNLEIVFVDGDGVVLLWRRRRDSSWWRTGCWNLGLMGGGFMGHDVHC